MSKLFSKDTPLIGLDLSTPSIRVMSIDAKKWDVIGYNHIDVDPMRFKEAIEAGNDDDIKIIADSIKSVMTEKVTGIINGKRLAISVPTSRTFCRTFTLPFSIEKNLREAVTLEAEQYIPIPSSSLYIDFEIIERDKSKKLSTILMNAIPKAVIDNIVKIVDLAGYEPIIIEPSISSVSRILATTEDATLPTVVVDIGPTNTDIAILDKGFLRVTGGIQTGGNTFTLDIAKKLNIAIENAHQLKVLNGLSAGPRQNKLKEALSPSLEKVIAEVSKVIRYYTERINPDQKLEQLLIVGSGGNLPGIGEYFTENLVIAARVASPWQKLDFAKTQEPPRQDKPRYLAVAGLASIDPRKAIK